MEKTNQQLKKQLNPINVWAIAFGCIIGWGSFVKIVLPISMTIIAVIGLYAAVGYWNAYKPGLMYIRNDELFPLQVILRELLLVNMNDMMVVGNGEVDQMRKAEQIKYGIIVVSTLPIMCLYPMLQRFFAKGVMIGAVKG